MKWYHCLIMFIVVICSCYSEREVDKIIRVGSSFPYGMFKDTRVLNSTAEMTKYFMFSHAVGLPNYYVCVKNDTIVAIYKDIEHSGF